MRDNCPLAENPDQLDTDRDGQGNACDDDDDNDGVLDGEDVNPLDPARCRDQDQDFCDDCAVEVDGFGPEVDATPDADGTDTDGDGLCDEGDDDDDGDTVNDEEDVDPLDRTACRDADGDGCDDCTQGFGPNTFTDGLDGDADGVCNDGDNCPADSNADQSDIDFDGTGDVCDPACEPVDVETCGDGIDNDCDEEVDEGCNGCRLGVLVTPGWSCVPATGPDGYVMGSPGPECPDGGCIDPRCDLEEGCPQPETNRQRIGRSELQHVVTLTHAMMVRRTLVTQTEWSDLTGTNPAFFPNCPTCPVERVSWPEILHWMNLKSEEDGLTPCYDLDACQNVDQFGLGCEEHLTACDSPFTCGNVALPDPDCDGYRMMTDAEHEYTTRAGTFTAWYTGTDNDQKLVTGWSKDNSGFITHPVADEANVPQVCNGWGLCDMTGNVHQYVFDRVTPGDDHVFLQNPDPVAMVQGDQRKRSIRGASWNRPGYRMRSSYRHSTDRDRRGAENGFRHVRYLPCVDTDGDLYGEGLGCFAEDCVPDDPAVNEGAGNCPPD